MMSDGEFDFIAPYHKIVDELNGMDFDTLKDLLLWANLLGREGLEATEIKFEYGTLMLYGTMNKTGLKDESRRSYFGIKKVL